MFRVTFDINSFTNFRLNDMNDAKLNIDPKFPIFLCSLSVLNQIKEPIYY